MTTPFDDNQEISEMTAEHKTDLLKSYASGRDPKTGRFNKGHSGNLKGRPPVARTLDECFNKVFAQKTNMSINGKVQQTTMLQAACYMLLNQATADKDVKLLMQILKFFGPKINLSEELPPSKAKPFKPDPTVEMIKKTLLNQIDKESGISIVQDNEKSSDS